MKLIALTGLPRSGKDTVGDYLVSRYGFLKASFAHPLKMAASTLLDRPLAHCNGDGYDREQIMPEWGFSMRWFLQKFGTECIREQIRFDFWVTHMKNRLESFKLSDPNALIVITDTRFENEAAMVREQGGKLIGINRNLSVGSDHMSDRGLSLTPEDFLIFNDGTLEQLKGAVDKVVAEIGI